MPQHMIENCGRRISLIGCTPVACLMWTTCTMYSGYLRLSETQHLGTRWRNVPGTFVGQEIWNLDEESVEALILSTLRRRYGWLHWELCSSELVNVCTAVLSQLLSRTFSVRLLVLGSLQSVCKAACPCFVEGLAAQQVVVEVSSCPTQWARRMTGVQRSRYAP